MGETEMRVPRGRAAVLVAVLAASCTTPPEQAMVARQPSTAAARTVSNFSEGLRCMDDLLWQHGKRDVYITSNGVPDATGRLLGGTKEMLITAVSRMSDKSNAFSFVDFEPTLDSVNALYWMVGVRPEFRAPSYYIRGAVTQFDENVLADATSAGVSLPKLDLSVSKDQVVSVISVDLNVGELTTRRILPGITASNSIAVVSTGKGADLGGVIGKGGVSFNVALNRSEGMHQALRTLIELSTIEVLGKLTQVPYWQCLGLEQTDPAFMTEARGWFDGMSASDRISYAQRMLAADGYYSGQPTGSDDEATRSALGRWQSDHDVIANGRMEFDTYMRMLSVRKSGGATVTAAAARVPPASAPSSAPVAPDLFLSSDRGPQPKYRAGEALVVKAQPTADGFLYCYYSDSKGQVARIYPNRFQPDAFVEANRQVEIPPGPARPFNLRMDQPGASEEIACVVSPQEVGLALPEAYKADDLQVIPQARLSDVLAAFSRLPKTSVKAKEMPVAVLPSTGG
jgi:curli biogenesis system outer membrane secretion channel CsgG